MRSALDHLRAAVADLTAARDDLDRQIAVLNRTMGELEKSHSGVPIAVSPIVPVAGDESRPIRDIVIELGSRKPTFSLEQVVTAAHREGNNAKSASISSILSRMKQQGEIDSVRRGVYALTKSEAPESSGASAMQTDTSVGADDPQQEGGTNDDHAHLGGHPPIGD